MSCDATCDVMCDVKGCDAMRCDVMIWCALMSWGAMGWNGMLHDVMRCGCVWCIGRRCAVNHGEPMLQQNPRDVHSNARRNPETRSTRRLRRAHVTTPRLHTTNNYSVLQSTATCHKVLLPTTKYYTPIYPVQHSTGLQSTTPYCRVVLRTVKYCYALQNTTPHYSVLQK